MTLTEFRSYIEDTFIGMLRTLLSLSAPGKDLTDRPVLLMYDPRTNQPIRFDLPPVMMKNHTTKTLSAELIRQKLKGTGIGMTCLVTEGYGAAHKINTDEEKAEFLRNYKHGQIKDNPDRVEILMLAYCVAEDGKCRQFATMYQILRDTNERIVDLIPYQALQTANAETEHSVFGPLVDPTLLLLPAETDT